MELLNKYNSVIIEIAETFAKKYYKEAFQEDDYEYQLMDYKGIKHMLEICDEYYNIEDMIMTLEYDIPIKTLRERYDLSLEAHMGGEPMNYNLYNYNIIKNENN